ncbi:uncharacterized protein A1O9_07395 [Exophiala aquamarina CBS 119918]|uniref:Rieske domain-containing protein n=1 Tax=Exophiala aquamarina CBS 119918 TaxID=1182545 RepID=A0A072PNX5_9EURO|nr:uncharacterized protein A1O9_07395 [Exophiala aquamarina CBS 119918]KEF57205.1 hypothetical protein A1O9_07395 [Exophiala aquamarina CBS 119918]
MVLILSQALADIPLPAYIFAFSCVVYLFSSLIVKYLQAAFFLGVDRKDAAPTGSTLDLVEKGSLKRDESLSDEEVFQLERRAFFSRTWLFVCHRSRFSKAGDYHAFDIAGISFFVVLGKDSKIRAFHNVCRHRAYTVVRKSCGNSTRFSCKYHGWQYDDEGKLVKAPKFEESPGFNHEENGLFEVKLILTREGLIFVNFDARTMNLPFNDVKSHINLGSSIWMDGFDVRSTGNWKDIANEFSKHAQGAQSALWRPKWLCKTKQDALLGPLSVVKEMHSEVWYTVTLLPHSFAEVTVRCDLYRKEGHKISPTVIEKCKSELKAEISVLTELQGARDNSRSYFAYQCGGRTIDLFAILSQHQRSENLSKRRLQPAIRLTGTGDSDNEAAALCDTLDGAMTLPLLEKCSTVSSLRRSLDW